MIKRPSVRYELFLLELLASVLARVSINGTKQYKHKQLGDEGLFLCASTLQSFTEGSLGRNSEAGPDAEPVEECCFLVCSPALAQPFLRLPEPPVQGWHHHGELTGPSPINQENIPQSCPEATLWWVNFLN